MNKTTILATLLSCTSGSGRSLTFGFLVFGACCSVVSGYAQDCCWSAVLSKPRPTQAISWLSIRWAGRMGPAPLFGKSNDGPTQSPQRLWQYGPRRPGKW